MDTQALIDSHQHWLQSRARKLARLYRADFDDCLSTLTVYLLEYRSRKTAWLRSRDEISRQCDIKTTEQALTQDNVIACLSGVDEVDFRDFIETHLDLTERHIIEMLLRGMTQQEIADELGMWQPTVCLIIKEAFEVIRQEWPDAT